MPLSAIYITSILMSKASSQLQQNITSFLIALTPTTTTPQYLSQLPQLRQQAHHTLSQQSTSFQLKRNLQAKIPKNKMRRYQQLMQTKQQNQHLIKIIEKGKHITLSMERFLNLNQNNMESTHQHNIDGNYQHNMESNHQHFIVIIEAIVSFEQFLTNPLHTHLNLNTLREQLYLKMIGKINTFHDNLQRNTKRFTQLIQGNGLPLKKQDIKKQPIPQKDAIELLTYLHYENCLLSLQKYLLSRIERQQVGSGGLLSIYWRSTVKMIEYLFISKAELRNLQQPAWMFEYIQHTLNNNYRYLLQMMHSISISKEIQHSIRHHFLTTTYQALILTLLHHRFQQDLPSLNSFLLFNFIDQLFDFQEKMGVSFDIRPSFVEAILLHYQQKKVLSKILQFEEGWFNKKIFEDFVKIDYSKISLKNLDAYNIVINFLSLLEKLYRKYTHLHHHTLKHQIISFYHKQILNIIAHVKTSFDRIYNYSKYPKIQVLLSFKRVQNELRGSLSQFLAVDGELQQNLQRQYYSFLCKYFQACALESVTPTHRNLHISLGQILSELSVDQQSKHQEYLSSFGNIYSDWNTKMQQIIKFNPYSDNKVRTIFFTYLEATSFSQVGLNLYLKIFQPYLKTLFSDDRYRLLMHLITIEKTLLEEYIQSHSEPLLFLSKEEKRQIKWCKNNMILLEL